MVVGVVRRVEVFRSRLLGVLAKAVLAWLAVKILRLIATWERSEEVINDGEEELPS
jgi:hypothetical protein